MPSLLGLEGYGSDEEDAPKAPPPQTKKRPVKFTVELPKGSQDDEGSSRPPKRPRTMGAGKSVLLNMLPPPSKPVPTSSTHSSPYPQSSTGEPRELPFLPTPLSRKQSTPHPDTSSASFFTLPSKVTSNSLERESKDTLVSSAPAVDDFHPPEPSIDDEYPGYYRLPSGKWGQYDSEYYRSFWEGKQAEWEAQHETTTEKGFEHVEDGAQEVNAADQLNHAQKLREEKKALTKNTATGPVKPNMNMEAPKGSRARYRHQLTALLSEAYERREELEEKIAEARRNRKEAGNKYGF